VEGLVVMLSLLVGAVLATAVSMAGLRLITSFVSGPDARPQPVQDSSEAGAAPRAAGH
jgi:ABC-type spermidine/putrescine transport system permease subunit II